MSSFFKVLRPGINSTFQDLGRYGLQHFGFVASGYREDAWRMDGHSVGETFMSLSVK